ncbi:MAG: hypothetical protein JWO22_4225 [Frankiales bacterium]|nr:hypothetical protein [Frankiales bacterium]
MLLLHHVGRKSGKAYVAPMMYLAGAGDTVYVFASKAGAPDDPDWYDNAIAAGRARVEIGTQAFDVTVEELSGETRDTVYARQARAYPGFAGTRRGPEGSAHPRPRPDARLVPMGGSTPPG